MRHPPTRQELQLALACLALLLLALFAPALAQPAHAHDFADRRALFGIPCALDVLSNLPFAFAGVLGLFALRRADACTPTQRALAALFFAGLLATAAGSSWYHLGPDDAGLAIDRHAMSIAFAGLLGLLVATQLSERGGALTGAALLVLGPAAVQAWAATGNVLPWAVLQFGGMGMVVVLACLPPRPGAMRVRWGWVIAAYALAKLCEVNDHAVFDATQGLLSGHTLKHVVAAQAAWPVIAAARQVPAMQNGRQEPAALAVRA